MGKFHAWVYEELTLHVRVQAWWAAVPVDPPQNDPRSRERSAQKERQSRLEEHRAAEGDATFEPDMPEVPDELRYLLGALFDAGPLSSVGMGGGVLTWHDIEAWERGTATELQPWERRVLRQLSSEYIKESRRAEKPGCPCPVKQDGTKAPVMKPAEIELKARMRALAAMN